MTFNLKILENKRRLQTCIKVGLPDGSLKLVEWVGDEVIKPQLILKNVMYVEGFKHNLLSIDKVLENSNIHVNFTKNNCYFQDQTDLVIALLARLRGYTA